MNRQSMQDIQLNIDAEDVLRYAVDRHILDIDTLLDEIQKMQREEILKLHKQEIWLTTKGEYATHVYDEHGKRLYRRRKTRRELDDFLVEHYKKLIDIKYIDDVFNEWIDRKLEFNEIGKSSYDRYKDDYKRFFSNNQITKIPFKRIDEDYLEVFIKSTIKELQLSEKSYAGLRTLIRGIFKYGKHRKYTNLSITSFFGDLELSKSMFHNKVHNPEGEVFSESEIPIIIRYLMEHPDIKNLAILLDFYTGLRVGELSALKFSDVSANAIRIQRTEQKIKDANGKWTVVVVEHTKTEAGYREVIIPEKAIAIIGILKRMNHNSDFIFSEGGKRIRGTRLNKRVATICKTLGLKHRSIHKIRKTYGTTLIDSNVDDAFIAQQMGHADVSTTRKIYYLSNKSRKTKESQIENAINF